MVTTAPDDPKIKVYVSYSRTDIGFADELVEGLEFDGRFKVSIDRHSITETKNHKARVGVLIEDADTMVFILSPESVQSTNRLAAQDSPIIIYLVKTAICGGDRTSVQVPPQI